MFWFVFLSLTIVRNPCSDVTKMLHTGTSRIFWSWSYMSSSTPAKLNSVLQYRRPSTDGIRHQTIVYIVLQYNCTVLQSTTAGYCTIVTVLKPFAGRTPKLRVVVLAAWSRVPDSVQTNQISNFRSVWHNSVVSRSLSDPIHLFGGFCVSGRTFANSP